MPKVLISDKLSPRAAEIFRERGIDVDVDTGLDAEALKAQIGDYDGLAVRSATKVTADVLAAADRLAVVGRAGIGVDNIDLAAATDDARSRAANQGGVRVAFRHRFDYQRILVCLARVGEHQYEIGSLTLEVGGDALERFLDSKARRSFAGQHRRPFHRLTSSDPPGRILTTRPSS